MAKKILAVVKIQAPGGAATPAPPVGPALGQHGVNIGEVVGAFNAKTADKRGILIPAIITIFEDRSFTMQIKSPPASVLIKRKINLDKGSNEPHKVKVGKISFKQCIEIAREKGEDLNAFDDNAAGMIIAGTARSMGVEVDGAPLAKNSKHKKI